MTFPPSTAPAIMALLFTAIGMSACDSGDGGWRGTARDSAGIQIMENPDQGIWREADVPRFEEVLRIGSSAGDSLYQFGAVVGADIASDGSVYVLDMQTRVVRVYDAEGKHVRNIGRAGTGPGEFAQGTALFLTPGDTLLVSDMGKFAITRFAPDGTILPQIPMQFSEGLAFKWVELADGKIAVQMRVMTIPNRVAVTDPRDVILLRNPGGDVIDTLLTMPSGATMQFGGPGQMKLRLFSPEPMWTVSDDITVYKGVNSEYSISAYDSSGAVRYIVRRAVAPQPVTDDDKNTFRKMMRDAGVAAGAPEAAMEMFTQQMEFEANFPSIGNIFAGPDGTLWVQRSLSAEEMKALGSDFDPQDLGSPNWDVYDNQGRLLGMVKLPQKFTPMRFVGDRLLGISRDDNDVQFITILRVGLDR